MRSINVDSQRCINLYPEMDELGTEKDHEIGALVGTPGLLLLATLSTSPCRGLYTATNGTLYACYGNTLYTLSSTWSATTVGAINSSSGPVSMSDNGLDLVLVDGTDGWYTALGTTTLTQYVGAFWLGANQVTLLDGYFVFNKPNSYQFYNSDQLSININAINFASKETPDNIVGLISNQRNLWLLGNETSEVWFDAGNPTGSPFSIIQGGYMEIGCASAFSIQKMNNLLYWLAKDKSGKGIVVQASGYNPQRISTHAVEYAIQNYGDLSGTVAYTYQENGHYFYALNFINANTTWVFDASTKLWHERVYTNQGLFQRHLAQCHAFAYNTSVVGDYQSGNLYQMSSSVYLDNGGAITRQRISPHLSDDMKRIFYSYFQLDAEPGVGIDGSGQGISPTVILQFSDDGGHTWSNEKWTTLGAIGNTKARAIWRRLGFARDRVFKITITDPVKVTLIGAELGLLEAVS